ncbi:Spc97/Spc98 family protein [Sodiomyces alkalinus F11]|uniref:Spindle pole body component n=1 Tax=Sodiomyces alkalinus (strain CBS 110278 / VKM F-3762 / F11) TaxID=1314773 RepID=A0A3N2PW10_SODAK|nr:Spc97/Spc98 family protein [Sodiomyces alkalinus F11]ROT38685.1 Spc97/Spc98 family protein [Sodiomyces alkalinus F11]
MSDEHDRDGNVFFAVPDFWKSSKWLHQDEDSQLAEPTKSSTSFFTLDLNDRERPSIFHVPPIECNNFFVLPDTGHADNDDDTPLPTASLECDDKPHLEGQDEVDRTDIDGDFWLYPGKPAPSAPEYRTWEAFTGSAAEQDKPVFVTEAGPGAFDALISLHGDPLRLGSADYTPVDPGPYLDALLFLALGRESVFFSWHGHSRSFEPTLPKARLPGYSGRVLQGVQDRCLRCGNAIRNLKTFADHAYSTDPTPCRVALASALDKALLVVQSHVAHLDQNPRSIIQLESVIYRVSELAVYLETLITKIRREHLDEDVLSLIFEQAQSAEYGHDYIRHTMRELLQRVTRPWLDFLEEWIGTQLELGIPLSKHHVGKRKGFIKVESEVYVDDLGLEVENLDFHLDTSRMPPFMPDDVVQAIFETGRNLRFIRSSHPEHFLAHPYSETIKTPTVRWQFDWDSIYQFERDVRSYEQTLLDAIQAHGVGGSSHNEASMQAQETSRYELCLFGRDEEELERRLLQSMATLSQPNHAVPSDDDLVQAVRRCLSADEPHEINIRSDFSSPHWSLLPVLSLGPIVFTQTRIIGRESLKLLFNAHDLRGHLRLQRDYFLCRNGMFCSRLSHALFDPDLETAERTAGVARQGGVMGLRLSGRDTWPPASSELRLALMGVLTETYEDPAKQRQTGEHGRKPGDTKEVPSDLSFTVRDLSSEEIDKCIDPDGLEALDFLRLAYKPPSALASIITPMVLAQYDRVFWLLLRVLRMLYTVNQLFRDVTARESRWRDPDNASVRFCLEARHFVSSLSSYFLDVGIEMPWRDFERKLDTVEGELLDCREGAVPNSDLSPDRLRELHVSVLERIMSALILRKRHQPVLKLLDDIFRVILCFAKLSRLHAEGLNVGRDQEKPAELYKVFRRNVEVFLTVCRGMAEKTSNRGHRSEGSKTKAWDERGLGVQEDSPIAQLLVKLDMLDYYSSK